jgi:hypothetical protein
MTVTAYQINNVLNAYTRQSKVRVTAQSSNDEDQNVKYRDIVSLSTKEANKSEELDRISYNLRDVILKDEVV